VAFLEQNGHSIDLTQLIGGPQFTMNVKVSWHNKSTVLSSLIDTGANAYSLIHRQKAGRLAKALKTSLRTLPTPISLKGFDGQDSRAITTTLQANLLIDGHFQKNVCFLVADLGVHDIILGRKWLATHDILPDCKRKILYWPEDHQVEEWISRRLRREEYDWTLRKRLETGQVHIARRPPDHESKPAGTITQEEDLGARRDLYQKRRAELDIQAITHKRNQQPPTEACPLDAVCFIGAVAFGLNAKLPESLVGTISIAEIDHVLEKRGRRPPQTPRFTVRPGWEFRQRPLRLRAGCKLLSQDLVYALDEDDLQDAMGDTEPIGTGELSQLRSKLPDWLHDMAQSFSKQAADILPPSRSFDHKLSFVGDPPEMKTSHLYKMSTPELEKMREYLIENLKKGFIRPSESPFSSPVLFVKKKDGTLRFCIDYRKLNEVTKKDRYPLPLIQETLARLSKASVFSKLDIRHAFNRILMNPQSTPWAAFRTRYGSFEPVVLPFGLCNGPATFQRYINSVLMDHLDVFCSAYIDDVLIFSENKKDHRHHVRTVVAKLQEAGLQIDLKKCEFEVTQTTFLGFIITNKGVQVDPAKTKVVRDWPEPITKKGVQSFLGFCNFYRIFILSYSRVARPLYGATKTDLPTKIEFNDDQRAAFRQLKELLLSAPVLSYFQPDRETRLEADCSDLAAGAVLTQLHSDDQKWHPVAFFSKTLHDAETHYEIHDKELLAIILGIKEWRAELTSLPSFLIITDHKALEYFGNKQLLNERQIRWMELLSQFNYTISYRPGRENTIADILSRKDELTLTQKAAREKERTRTLFSPDAIVLWDGSLRRSVQALNTAPHIDTLAPQVYIGQMLTPDGVPNRTVPPPVVELDLSPVVAVEDLDTIAEALHQNKITSEFEVERARALAGDPIWSIHPTLGLLLHEGRLVVPKVGNLQTRVIRQAHDTTATAHPGQTKSKALIKRLFWWPRMSRDIEDYVANCHLCRTSHKPRDKTPGLLHPLPVPLRTWNDLSMDFHEPGTTSDGYDNIFVVVDRLSKRHACLPTTKTATAKTAASLFYQYLWRFRGCPLTITSDRGPQFISDFMDELSTLTRTKLKLSTSEHPQTDGQTEIVNQIIDGRLRPFVNHFQDDWADLLPALDAAGAALPHESTGLSPSMVDYGYEPRLDFDWTLITAEPRSPREKINREEARTWAKRIDKAVQFARSNMLQAQERQSRQANKKRRVPNFGPSDMVYIIKKSWRTDRPSDKLDFPLAGPFKILEMVGHSYRVELPTSYRVWPIFHADRLRKDPGNPLPGQINAPPPALEVDGELEWEVEKILSSRISRGKLQYKVAWKGWDPDNEWYPASNFKNAPLLLKAYHKQYPAEAGPPKRLKEWIRQAEENTQSEIEHPNDDLAEKDDSRKSRRRRR
jgi:hypothetical protein